PNIWMVIRIDKDIYAIVSIGVTMIPRSSFFSCRDVIISVVSIVICMTYLTHVVVHGFKYSCLLYFHSFVRLCSVSLNLTEHGVDYIVVNDVIFYFRVLGKLHKCLVGLFSRRFITISCPII